MLVECEDALNQGGMTAAEVVINLRIKSILHLFASTGRFLGLKVIIKLIHFYSNYSRSIFLVLSLKLVLPCHSILTVDL